mgnify:CR=1 FL=1
MTARWVVEHVASERNLRVVWQPISLLFKNDPNPESEYFAGAVKTHRMLRVMEAVRSEHGDDAVSGWYWLCCARVHHDKTKDFDLGDALAEIGLPRSFADAADDERWDRTIRERMAAGLALVGDNVGTPIIAFTAEDGIRRGIFGPVITRVPAREQALRVWDAMYDLTLMDDFWELKRTRTVGPDVGERPTS